MGRAASTDSGRAAGFPVAESKNWAAFGVGEAKGTGFRESPHAAVNAMNGSNFRADTRKLE